jgi:pyridoxamine 5'-phosphate oxidase
MGVFGVFKRAWWVLYHRFIMEHLLKPTDSGLGALPQSQPHPLLGAQTALGGPETIWHHLHSACADRQHGWRTPVLASTDLAGYPTARTVVLREADAALQQLVMFTDKRSPKVQELQRQPRAMLVFWCAKLSWQLRAVVQVQVLTHGPRVERAWERLQHSAAAADYLQSAVPGAAQPAGTPVPTAPATASLSPAAHQLGILVATVQQLDWLELSRQGHRRVLLTQSSVQELVP